MKMSSLYWILLFLTIYSVESHSSDHADIEDFYSHTVEDIRGLEVSLEEYRGMVTLVVNVASECGFTDGHYRGLTRLHNMLAPTQKFTILAFPCNQFGRQEPQGNKEILNFAQQKYNVKFPIFSKINVLEDFVPFAWQYLIDKSDSIPNWNFYKYLVDYDGKVLNAWGPWTDVETITPEVKRAVTEALNAHGPPRPYMDPVSDDQEEPYMESGPAMRANIMTKAEKTKQNNEQRGFTAGQQSSRDEF